MTAVCLTDIDALSEPEALGAALGPVAKVCPCPSLLFWHRRPAYTRASFML